MSKPSHDTERCTCRTDPGWEQWFVSSEDRNQNRISVGLPPLEDMPDFFFHRMTSEEEEQQRHDNR